MWIIHLLGIVRASSNILSVKHIPIAWKELNIYIFVWLVENTNNNILFFTSKGNWNLFSAVQCITLYLTLYYSTELQLQTFIYELSIYLMTTHQRDFLWLKISLKIEGLVVQFVAWWIMNCLNLKLSVVWWLFPYMEATYRKLLVQNIAQIC